MAGGAGPRRVLPGPDGRIVRCAVLTHFRFRRTGRDLRVAAARGLAGAGDRSRRRRRAGGRPGLRGVRLPLSSPRGRAGDRVDPSWDFLRGSGRAGGSRKQAGAGGGTAGGLGVLSGARGHGFREAEVGTGWGPLLSRGAGPAETPQPVPARPASLYPSGEQCWPRGAPRPARLRASLAAPQPKHP